MTNIPKPKKVYISGKVSDEDYQKAYKKFADTAELLTEFGFQPINPMLIVDSNTMPEDVPDIVKPYVINADIVLFLPDSNESHGCRLERHWAQLHKVEIAEYSELLGIAKENCNGNV